MSSNNLVAWPSDLRIQGYRVRFPARAGHFWVTFWSCRGHFFVIFGTSWDVFGSAVGTFLDGFGRVSRKKSDEVDKSFFLNLSGSMFPASGRSKQLC